MAKHGERTVENIFIHVHVGSDGGLHYDVFVGDDGIAEALSERTADDGGICTSGMHDADCKNDDCEGCEKAMSKAHTSEDWKNALGMATEQAAALLK